MREESFDLVTVPGGARSLRSLDHGETFHPGIGPMEEARTLHLIQHHIPERLRPDEPFVVWDVGLGAAANALAVVEALASSPVDLISFDQFLDPLRFALAHAAELDYPARWTRELAELLASRCVRIGAIT
jgi:queuine tRNA-ribosyltransferase